MLRKRRSPAVGVALVALLLVAAACVRAGAPPPSVGDCATVRVWSNGFHTNLAFSADALGEAHPLRDVFPEARHFLVGWGERDYYIHPNPGVWLALKAVLPPGRSVMQVIAAAEPVEDRLWPPTEIVDVAVSEAGLGNLAGGVARTLSLDGAGRPIVLDTGRVHGASVFLEAEPAFHPLHMCNQWTAARLADAGVPLRPVLAFTASGLIRTLEEIAPSACPAGPS